MIIKIPDNFIPERTYITGIILDEFLGFKFETAYHKGPDYEMILDNGNTLTIKDRFFSSYKEKGFAYDREKLPVKTKFLANDFTVQKDIPVIFGDDRLEISGTKIICGIDIFASSFFMLTRWEEYAVNSRDEHGRFSAKESTAFKNGFLVRPVVNEYASMLSNMLAFLKHGAEVKKRGFSVMPTHDVDQPLWSARSIFKRTVKDFISKKDLHHIASNISLHMLSKKNPANDPYNTFGYLMDQSEKHGRTSRFFFQSAVKCGFDAGYDIGKSFFSGLFRQIAGRGHVIGFHPGYHTFDDGIKWKEEYRRLTGIVRSPVKCGRQHYLRFDVPATWQIWEDNGMEWDSSMTYHDKEGFRSGTCFEYGVFNILSRKKLRLKEKPLMVMEGSFFQYQNFDCDLIIQKILELKNTVRKYNGEFVFLWHNSSFNAAGYEKNKIIYEEIIK